MSGDDSGGGGGQSLDGRPQPMPASWNRPSSNPRPSNPSSGPSSGRRIAGLGDLGSAAGGGGMQPMFGSGAMGGSNDDDDDSDGEAEGESWFAGGERSGISVQNPDAPGNVPGGNLVRDLLRRAAAGGPPPPPTAIQQGGAFSGGGNTLGSDEIESQFIPDPNARHDEEEQDVAIRQLTLWREGFSVDDGPLLRYDNPEHARTLEEINTGRAPPNVLNVLPNQQVELRVVKRLTDTYEPPPKRPTAAFEGSGNRLGAPVPEVTSSSAGSVAMPGAMPGNSVESDTARSAASVQTRFEVDQNLPTTSVQVRLADGTRMVCRMNLTHTVGDIRNFINASRPENLSRPYTVGTTFPNRVLEDNSQTIKDAGLAGTVVVQRWV